jgi:ribosomal protein S18 acetylase RimI-like enzyme
MQQDLKIAIEAAPTPADMHIVVGGLVAYNASKSNGDTPNYYLITVRGQDGQVVGGLMGATYLGWTQVNAVWMPEALRGQGIGTRLMALAEQVARERGCPRIFLETLSFQALPFYEKLGYQVVSRIEGFPPGGVRYALTKILD